MNLDLPQNLHATRDLLIGSISTHASEQAPAMPTALLEDLTRSAAIQPVELRQNHIACFFDSLRSLIATPAFGSAAAAIMVLAVASTVILRPDSGAKNDTFRGAGAYTSADSARVVLVSAPVGMQHELEATTDFENGVFLSAATTESTTDLKGARVIVDFSTGTITAISAKGEKVYKNRLPESASGLSLEIASALIRL